MPAKNSPHPQVPPLQAQGSGRRPHRRPRPLPGQVRQPREPRTLSATHRRMARLGPSVPSRGRPGRPPVSVTINELILAYWRHAEKHYRGPDRKPTQELENMRDALRPLRKLYGSTPAADFGPLALRSIQQEMVGSGSAGRRSTPGSTASAACSSGRSGVELIPPSVHQALQAVPGLQKGRTDARGAGGDQARPDRARRGDPAPLNPGRRRDGPDPAPDRMPGRGGHDHARLRPDAGRAQLGIPPVLAQDRLAGQGAGISVGPKAQEIVQEFLKADLQAYLFDPRDVVEAHHAERARKRKSRPTPSEIARRCKGRPGRTTPTTTTAGRYRQAVVRACDRAFPHPVLSRINPKKLTADQRQNSRNGGKNIGGRPCSSGTRRRRSSGRGSGWRRRRSSWAMRRPT